MFFYFIYKGINISKENTFIEIFDNENDINKLILVERVKIVNVV